MAWEDLKPNMPWLVDAAVCVLLDLFVSFVFVDFARVKFHACSDFKELTLSMFVPSDPLPICLLFVKKQGRG